MLKKVVEQIAKPVLCSEQVRNRVLQFCKKITAPNPQIREESKPLVLEQAPHSEAIEKIIKKAKP